MWLRPHPGEEGGAWPRTGAVTMRNTGWDRHQSVHATGLLRVGVWYRGCLPDFRHSVPDSGATCQEGLSWWVCSLLESGHQGPALPGLVSAKGRVSMWDGAAVESVHGSPEALDSEQRNKTTAWGKLPSGGRVPVQTLESVGGTRVVEWIAHHWSQGRRALWRRVAPSK